LPSQAKPSQAKPSQAKPSQAKPSQQPGETHVIPTILKGHCGNQASESDAEGMERYALMGSCYGFVVLPQGEVADYYRGYRLMAAIFLLIAAVAIGFVLMY
jgi:hypothetical protein